MHSRKKGIREIWSWIFASLFLLFILLFLITGGLQLLVLLPQNFSQIIFWCLAFAALGSQIGLWATRLDAQSVAGEPWHYIIYYCFFVWPLASLTALASFYAYYPDNKVFSYIISSLIGIVVSMQGDQLLGNLLKLKSKWPW